MTLGIQNIVQEQFLLCMITRDDKEKVESILAILRLFGGFEILTNTNAEIAINAVIRRSNGANDDAWVWLIGGDLSCDWMSMAALLDETDFENPDFATYTIDSRSEDAAAKPSLALGRLKIGLARKIVASPTALQRLRNVGLAAAVAEIGNGIVILEWSKHETLRRFFRPDFPHCETTQILPGIHYPVSDPALRQAICAQNLDLADRIGGRVVKYTGNKVRGWFVDDTDRWIHWFGRTDPTRVLEVGDTDGISTNAMLDMLFSHPASEVHCIQTGGNSRETEESLSLFSANAAAGGHIGQVHLYTGQPVEILAWMIANEGYWESFDFICFRPGKDRIEALTAAGQIWSLLKPSGTLLFDCETARIGDSHPAKVILETCAQVIASQSDPLLTGDRIALKKRPAAAVNDSISAGRII